VRVAAPTASTTRFAALFTQLLAASWWRGACHGIHMALTHARLGLLVLLSLIPVREAAADLHSRIRPLDARLLALVERGMRTSPTFRALAARLEQSDVVVYLESDVSGPPRIAGRLTFVSAAGGRRYVVVRLRPLPSTLDEVALLAHELQHAVEIAERPSIVDTASMEREYRRIGHVNRWVSSGLAFDTRAASDAGSQVARELRGIAVEAVAASR
jgi:hypothetical protein